METETGPEINEADTSYGWPISIGLVVIVAIALMAAVIVDSINESNSVHQFQDQCTADGLQVKVETDYVSCYAPDGTFVRQIEGRP